MFNFSTFVDNKFHSEQSPPHHPLLEDHPCNTNLISLKTAKNLNQGHNLTLLSLNIQSLNSHYDHLCALLDSTNNPELVIISESWQPRQPNTIISSYHPLIHFTRPSRKGGGCGIFIKRNLELQKDYVIHNLPTVSSFEYTYVLVNQKIKLVNQKYLIVAIYRPPSTKISDFLHEFKQFISLLSKQNVKLIIAGDINIAVNSINKNSKNYSKLLSDFQLLQTVQSFTHYSKSTQTIIDHVISNVNCTSHVINCQVTVGVGLHLPILTTFTMSKKWRPPPIHKYTFLETIDRNTSNIVESLHQKDWSQWITETTNLNSNETFNSLHDIIQNTVKNHTSIIKTKSKVRLKPRSPWITEKTLLLKQKANKLQKKYIRNKSLITYSALLDTTKEFKKNVRIDKATYYSQKLSDAQTNSREIWTIINEVLNRKNKSSSKINIIKYNDTTLSNPKDIAEGFNQFYKNIAVDLATKIPKSTYPPEHYLQYTPAPEKSFALKEISEHDILREIRSFKSKSSSGFDNLPNKLIKNIVPAILQPLTYTINKSYKENQFPERLKISKVTPLFKKGNPEDCNSYRPIHQVSGFSKLYEKVTMHQVKQFHQKHKVIPSNQFGFLPNTSTYHALLHTKNKIDLELHKLNYVLLISLDLSKCFDTLDVQDILPLKMHHYYKDPNTIKYLLSFFKGRKQFVKLGNENSELTDNYDISCVQGSSTGPIIYTLYSADSMGITKEFILCFADDTNLVVYSKDQKDLQSLANETLETINDYMCSNKLTLNVKKTVAILFTPPNKKAFPLNIYIGNMKVNQVKETKFLGVTLDYKLQFLTHFNSVVNKAKQGLSALVQTKKLLSYQAKLKIYHGLIQCHMQYCPIIWLYNQPQKNIRILETIQKKAIRLLFNAKPNSHTNNMFTTTNIIKVKDLCKNDFLKFMYQHTNNLLPTAISELLNEAQSQARPSRIKSNRENAKSYANTGQIAFDMIESWNSLEDPIKTKKFSILTVKKRIKMHLQLTSETICEKAHCFACTITPSLHKLQSYTHFICP